MKPVLVTTEYRGVFFGYLEDGADADLPNSVVLKNARMCVYWSADTKGVFGLISSGPSSHCRIGPKSDEIKLYGITSVSPVSAKAVKRWEDAPWSQ